jgi:subfamily B ATP-binding cassette protein HlyB/CyaB
VDKGQIVESGSHAALMDKPQGLYAYLWRMQDGTHSVDATPQPIGAAS